MLGFIFLYRGIRRRRAQLLGNAFPEGRLSSSDSGHVELVASQMEEQREQQRVYDQSSLGIFNQSSATQEQPSRSYNSGNIRSVAIAAPIGGVISPATSTPTRPTTVYHTHGWETDDHGVSPIDSPLFRPSLGGAASADRNIPEVHLTRASTNEQPAVMHQPPGISRLPISRR